MDMMEERKGTTTVTIKGETMQTFPNTQKKGSETEGRAEGEKGET